MMRILILSVFLTATSGISQAESFSNSKMVDANTATIVFENPDCRLTVASRPLGVAGLLFCREGSVKGASASV